MSSVFELSLERNLKSGQEERITLISLSTTPARELDEMVSLVYDKITEIDENYIKNVIIAAYQEKKAEQEKDLEMLENRMSLLLKSNLSAEVLVGEIDDYFSSKKYYEETIEQYKTRIDSFNFALDVFKENTTWKYHDDGEEDFKLTYYFA